MVCAAKSSQQMTYAQNLPAEGVMGRPHALALVRPIALPLISVHPTGEILCNPQKTLKRSACGQIFQKRDLRHRMLGLQRHGIIGFVFP